jgi:hypothetical protein
MPSEGRAELAHPEAAGWLLGTLDPAETAVVVDQDGPARPDADGSVDRRANRWWQRDQDDLGALAADPQHTMASVRHVLFGCSTSVLHSVINSRGPGWVRFGGLLLYGALGRPAGRKGGDHEGYISGSFGAAGTGMACGWRGLPLRAADAYPHNRTLIGAV